MPFENSPPPATASASAFEVAAPAVVTADNWSGAVGSRSLYADLFDKDEAAARIAASGTIYDEALQSTGGLHSDSLLVGDDETDDDDDDDVEVEAGSAPPQQQQQPPQQLQQQQQQPRLAKKVPRSKPEGRVRRASLYGELFGYQEGDDDSGGGSNVTVAPSTATIADASDDDEQEAEEDSDDDDDGDDGDDGEEDAMPTLSELAAGGGGGVDVDASTSPKPRRMSVVAPLLGQSGTSPVPAEPGFGDISDLLDSDDDDDDSEVISDDDDDADDDDDISIAVIAGVISDTAAAAVGGGNVEEARPSALILEGHGGIIQIEAAVAAAAAAGGTPHSAPPSGQPQQQQAFPRIGSVSPTPQDSNASSVAMIGVGMGSDPHSADAWAALLGPASSSTAAVGAGNADPSNAAASGRGTTSQQGKQGQFEEEEPPMTMRSLQALGALSGPAAAAAAAGAFSPTSSSEEGDDEENEEENDKEAAGPGGQAVSSMFLADEHQQQRQQKGQGQQQGQFDRLAEQFTEQVHDIEDELTGLLGTTSEDDESTSDDDDDNDEVDHDVRVRGVESLTPVVAPVAVSAAGSPDAWSSLLGPTATTEGGGGGGGGQEEEQQPMTMRSLQALHDLSGTSGGFSPTGASAE